MQVYLMRRRRKAVVMASWTLLAALVVVGFWIAALTSTGHCGNESGNGCYGYVIWYFSAACSIVVWLIGLVIGAGWWLIGRQRWKAGGSARP